jgi:hypothetical protein
MNFTLLLSYENWNDIFLEKDVNILFNNFLNTYLRIFYASFPNIKTKNASNPKPWLTTGIKISCAKKRELYLTYRKSNNPIHKEYYKSYCHTLSKVITSAKKLYYNNRIMKSNNKPKTTWNIVRTITNNKNTTNNITTMNVNNQLSNDPQTIVNAFNLYLSVAENLLTKISPGTHTMNNIDPLTYLRQNFNHTYTPMILKNTTTYEIDKIFHSIKSKNSSGYDEISSRILKVSAPYVLSPLTFIFNKILTTGVFSERIKFSEVKPLYKKGNTTDFSNYRPISLLTSFSKILEKIMYDILYCHLINNNILAKEQFGFREKLSSDTATYAFLHKILLSLDKRHYIGAICTNV